ncbi:YajQ family cyclic di-GMP-binding protein [Halomicronema sp. CCY15110]|uniref:YajQ family cyclic di-GMP-binding protein n=1 Tax=Halomicronema sp. CCY15110 TaxID=2767773 RepID=UPI00195186C2|nr:YajQ family cyclic di-GMP-binding protein [Halomicronema sp. CCY15110]
MASNYSFDVVSEFDRQELVNAIDQASREITNRYDLKDSKTSIDLSENTITLETDSNMTLQSVQSILQTKAAKRNLSLKIFDFGKAESASGGRVRQVVTLKEGIDKEIAKDISKFVRDNIKKAQASIQGDAVRVSAKSKDDLQIAIQLLKSADWPVALQFTNYR